jgi:hypothetical protein
MKMANGKAEWLWLAVYSIIIESKCFPNCSGITFLGGLWSSVAAHCLLASSSNVSRDREASRAMLHNGNCDKDFPP